MDVHVSIVVATLNRARMLDGSIRLVAEERRGLSHARNRGIVVARGSVIAFTDDDVIASPGWVAGIAAALERWHADGVGGRILPAWEAPAPAWLLADRRLLERLAIMEAPEATTLTLPVVGPGKVWGANMAFRRSLFETIGAFDPRLGVSGRRLFRGEETDLVQRALASGHRIVYEPAIVVSHRIGPERLRRSYFRRLFFDEGQSNARLADLTGHRTFLGAPLRLNRVSLTIARWLWRLARRRPRAFAEQMRWRLQLGQLIGHWRDAIPRPAGSDAATPMLERRQPADGR